MHTKPYIVNRKTCRICATTDGDKTCAKCDSSFHQRCLDEGGWAQNSSNESSITLCHICLSQNQNQATHTTKPKTQTTIRWNKRGEQQQNQEAQSEQTKVTENHFGFDKKTGKWYYKRLFPQKRKLIAYAGKEENGSIHIYRIPQQQGRRTYRKIKLLTKHRLVRVIPLNVQHAAMTRNPTQHERRQQQAQGGGGGGGVRRGRRGGRKRKRRQQQEQDG